ncbi:ECF transporter S component [Clostridium beijerinckii]|uniref:ECF transporter S component n=1 Tax=Clostridium beijerinckii TaxID=1520 RepID=A0A1S9N6P9_CLOBE|nr:MULTISPECIES: ECF transporter S component [Clostridium]MBN7572856.1 ECF transporter S component [Clostridium beijerinckii]MBN7578342.1 ECF transporter S component [Clostridium beijerinckii]MBN7582630.1 ECF transporter S component [Clostridium beijerinckii]MBO0521952.1 ECF transporter S component [Clostridium beijerinckii]MZK51785.1 ECF transporter S component [Clostridium beijerinckii]
MERGYTKSKFSVRQIAMIGMLSAISIFLGLTGLGFIPIPPVKATIMHIPVIIGAIVEGPIVGSLVGLVFGLFSMYQNFTAPGPTSFIFWNPIIALVPRVLIGIVAYYVYILLRKRFKNQSISIAIASICATLINTIGVLGLTYVFYLERYSAILKINPQTAGIAIATIGLTNGVPEAIVSAVISVPVIVAIFRIKKKV